MSSIGVMAMPADFRYRDVFLKGKPQHDRFDLFRIRHPSMDVGRRAKIFSPFDALKGFNEAIASKDVLYRERVELSDEDRTELDRRLRILKGLTYNGNMARKNRVKITVLFYVPCPDEHNEAFGIRGRYRRITGICWNVDPEISALVYDVFCLLHSYDWAESGDTDMDAYQKDVEIFKSRWFKKARKDRIKEMIDISTEKLKEDLYQAFGFETESSSEP